MFSSSSKKIHSRISSKSTIFETLYLEVFIKIFFLELNIATIKYLLYAVNVCSHIEL